MVTRVELATSVLRSALVEAALLSEAASFSAVRTAGFLFLCAMSTGVFPSLFGAFGSDPALSNAVTTAGVALELAARCRGSSPALSRAFGSAPALSSAAAPAGFSCCAAICRGVLSYPVSAFGSAPALVNAVTTAGLLVNAAARCKGVLPYSLRSFKSAPARRHSATLSGVASRKNASVFQPSQFAAGVVALRVEPATIAPRPALVDGTLPFEASGPALAIALGAFSFPVITRMARSASRVNTFPGGRPASLRNAA